tara:strand:- start:35408 stop:35707 length:300 start_codon:yes stop_codon:yes gene_type:complete
MYLVHTLPKKDLILLLDLLVAVFKAHIVNVKANQSLDLLNGAQLKGFEFEFNININLILSAVNINFYKISWILTKYLQLEWLLLLCYDLKIVHWELYCW